MISSPSNDKIKDVIALMKKPSLRNERGLFVVEGIKMIREIPEDKIDSLYISESFPGGEELKGEIVSDRVFEKMSDTRTPQGVLATVRMPKHTLKDCLRGKPALLILERIQDPGNLGTMMRMGEAAGITGIIMDRETVDMYNPKVVRSTMGAIFRVPFIVTDDLAGTIEEIKKAGVNIYAAHLKGENSYDAEDYTLPSAWLIGNESKGLSDETAALADRLIKIPMKGEVESLNAAIAATVLAFEMARQRR